jgi:hypothetical protein
MLHKNVKKAQFFKQRLYGNLGVRGTAESILEKSASKEVRTLENTGTNKNIQASQNDKL